MRRPVKARLLLPAVVTAALVAPGCGGSGGSGSNPATLAPPKAPVFIEVSVQPEGELKANIQSLAKSIAGVDDLGGLIVSELESSSGDSGDEVDFAKEIEPWLGEKGGLFLQEYDGEDFEGAGFAIQSTDVTATQDFIDEKSAESGEVAEEGSYQGVDYKVGSADGSVIGVIGDFFAYGEDIDTFKQMVDASDGESLADEATYSNAVDAAPSGSAADVFVDVGGLIDEAGGTIDPEAQQFLDSAGIDPEEATAVASLIPGADRIEVDFASNLSGDNPPTGDASQLLGELPAGSFAAIASADFGKRFGEAIDRLDANGIPGQIPAGKLKSSLEEAGIDLEKIAASVGNLAVFAEGDGKSSLAGAAVLEAKNSKEATNTVSNVGLLLRATGTAGVTAISGEASGFSIRSADLGPKPLVIAAKGERIAIAYGLPAAKRALATDSGQTLADDPLYEEAVSALGGTPITGFADGPAALNLASTLIPADKRDGFLEAKPYLDKIDYLAIGSGASGDLATARLIAGIGD
jgi:uncharacterized protein DUF3352